MRTNALEQLQKALNIYMTTFTTRSLSSHMTMHIVASGKMQVRLHLYSKHMRSHGPSYALHSKEERKDNAHQKDHPSLQEILQSRNPTASSCVRKQTLVLSLGL